MPGDAGEVTDEYAIYAIAVVALAATIALYRAVQRSSTGLLLASIRSREARTLAFGFDTAALKTRAFAHAAAVSGLAGALFVTQFNFASPTLIGFNLSAEALIWVALGGRRSVVTAALGAIAFRALEANLSGVIGETWLLIVGALFIRRGPACAEPPVRHPARGRAAQGLRIGVDVLVRQGTGNDGDRIGKLPEACPASVETSARDRPCPSPPRAPK